MITFIWCLVALVCCVTVCHGLTVHRALKVFKRRFQRIVTPAELEHLMQDIDRFTCAEVLDPWALATVRHLKNACRTMRYDFQLQMIHRG